VSGQRSCPSQIQGFTNMVHSAVSRFPARSAPSRASVAVSPTTGAAGDISTLATIVPEVRTFNAVSRAHKPSVSECWQKRRRRLVFHVSHIHPFVIVKLERQANKTNRCLEWRFLQRTDL
jgi:hypothetical protein